MNQVSDKYGWRGFLELCMDCDSIEDFERLFDMFFTMEEIDNVAGRYVIVRELLLGEKTQREIAEEQQLSIAKITRGSNKLKTVSEGMKQYLLKHYKT